MLAVHLARLGWASVGPWYEIHPTFPLASRNVPAVVFGCSTSRAVPWPLIGPTAVTVIGRSLPRIVLPLNVKRCEDGVVRCAEAVPVAAAAARAATAMNPTWWRIGCSFGCLTLRMGLRPKV